MPRAPTGLRAMMRNARCAKCNVVFERLLSCSACGSVAYCGRRCQRADWPFHRPLCRALVASNDADTNDGHKQLVFDRALGGFLSVVQRRMFLAHGHGVLVATLSTVPADFRPSVPVDPHRKRLITLRFVPQQDIPALDSSIAAASGQQNKHLVENVSLMTEQLFLDDGGRQPGQVYTLLTRTAPGVQSSYEPQVTMMINWLSPTHSAHTAFSSVLRFSDDQLIRTTFNWDTKEVIPPRGHHIRVLPARLILNIIDEDFYNECMRRFRRRESRLKRGMPVEENGMYPPFAQCVNIHQFVVPEDSLPF